MLGIFFHDLSDVGQQAGSHDNQAECFYQQLRTNNFKVAVPSHSLKEKHGAQGSLSRVPVVPVRRCLRT